MALTVPFRADPWRSAAVFVLTVAASLIGVLSAYWLKQIVDGARVGDEGAATAGAVGIGLTLGVGTLARSSVAMMQFSLTEKTGQHLERVIMGLVSGIPGIEHHESPSYAKRLDVLRREQRVLAFSGTNVADLVALAVQVAATSLLLASVTPLLLGVALFAVAPVWAGTRAERIRQAALDSTADDALQARHLFELATSRAAGKELRVFGVGGDLLRRHQRAWETSDRCLDVAGRAGLAWTAAAWLVFAVGYAAAVVVVVDRAVAGRASVGDIVLALALVGQVNRQVGLAVQSVGVAARTLRVADRFLWLVDHAAASQPVVDDPAPVPERLVRGIELRDVSFRYPEADGDVLAGVDLTLPAGATVAFVGDNGAGKSTLVKLLCRFYDPSAGRITVDGVDLRRIPADQWRARMGAGFQDFARFELRAGETVGVGDLALIDDETAVRAALDRAGSAAVTGALRDGLATRLGPSFDDGVDLSGGQWQKLALARGMMRPAPLLLVLDEPTAALDAETEHELFTRYASAAAATAADTGAITVIVSHRFSTVRMADLIVVVEGGHIVEAGSHHQLMARRGLYAELYDLQARAYR